MPTPALTIRHCTFRVGDQCVAVEADAVAEVITARTVTPVPLAPPGVLGLVHLRGRIVPVLDPAVRLGISAPADRPAATLLVLRVAGDDWCGIAVDEVLDVLDVPATALEHPTPPDDPDSPFAGILAAPDRLVHLVDHRRLARPPVRRPASPSTPE